MKKLLTIALLILSPVTFAETVTPEMLLGTWQCKTDGFTSPYVTLTWNDTASFYKEGFYQRKSVNLYDVVGVGKMRLIETSLGTWQLKDNILITQRRQSLGFRTDNPVLEKKAHIAKHVGEYDRLYYRIVEPISNDEFILRPTEEYKQQNEIINDPKDVCKRIH